MTMDLLSSIRGTANLIHPNYLDTLTHNMSICPNIQGEEFCGKLFRLSQIKFVRMDADIHGRDHKVNRAGEWFRFIEPLSRQYCVLGHVCQHPSKPISWQNL